MCKEPLHFNKANLYRTFWNRIFVHKMGEYSQTVGYAPTLMWETTALGSGIEMYRASAAELKIVALDYSADLEEEHGDIWGAHNAEVSVMQTTFAQYAMNYNLRLVPGEDRQTNPGWLIP